MIRGVGRVGFVFIFETGGGSSEVPVLQWSVRRSSHAILQCELGYFEWYYFK